MITIRSNFTCNYNFHNTTEYKVRPMLFVLVIKKKKKREEEEESY